MKKKNIVFLLVVLSLAVISRWLPHPPNFSPVAALALFSGVFFLDKRLAFLVPLSVMLVSDFFLGFHAIMPFVYVAFMCTVMIGFWIRQRIKLTPIVLSVLGSSILFFALTNFGVWLISGMYPRNTTGLVECYIAAVPFFQNSVLGNLLYSLIFIGGYRLANRSLFAEKTATL